MTYLHRMKLLRRFALPLLARFGSRDVTVSHAWHPEHRVRLNLFRHKGYWFHGKRREQDLMETLERLVRPGAYVVEIGCHIGWISLHLAKLVDGDGRLFAFEPSPNNLPYLRANLASFGNAEVIDLAVSDEIGEATFYVEPLTGQNDTLIKDYAMFDSNRASAYSEASYESITVSTTTLDDYFSGQDQPLALLKIDVEGAELMVLKGGMRLISAQRPVIAIEITQNKDDILALLLDTGYQPFDDALRPIVDFEIPRINWLFLHSMQHKKDLQ